jgi:hypothetical protein
MNRNKIIRVVIYLFFTILTNAQNNSNFSWGVYTSLNADGVQTYELSGKVGSGDDDFYGGELLGYSLGGTIQHQTLHWLGFRSGLIFQQRRYGYEYPDPNGGIYATLEGKRNMYMLSIPAIIRFTPGRVFSLNVGTEFNLALGSGKKEDWAWLEDPVYHWGDITLFTSFEFRLYRGLHIGTGISWGLTPWGESLVHTGNNPPKEINTYSQRSLFINLQYVFERK